MKVFSRCIGMLALVVALTGLTFIATANVVEATDCWQKLENVEVSKIGEGREVRTWCGITDEGEQVYEICYDEYWVFPTHQKCIESDENENEQWCCKTTLKYATLYEGKCILPGYCVAGNQTQPANGQNPPQYKDSKLLPCSNGEPHGDC